ncbi:glycosyltransferase [Acinetobacter johnsonii]|uniref:glycosyltransferase family 2 protein n=1 Tax=Acinetobacter johnsonii TaxID=40214 RepID=UPI001CC9E256|nr:glycosyltransferase [Acinetobacter johnsonii]UBQ38085.1 glycosyltransferase [Acinetobacter johnsonii]
MNKTVSVIVRTMPDRHNFLDKCLFVLSGQNYDDLEIVVVCQTTINNQDLSLIEPILSRWSIFFTKKIKFIHHYADFDARSKSLNIGVDNATGRYLSFLDDDDKIYPDHFKVCISNLENSTSVWCFTNCERALYNTDNQLRFRSNLFHGNHYSFLEHLTKNFIPIHAFVIDTFRISDLHSFNEQLAKHEDYDFLLQLAHKYKPSYIPLETVQYCIREGSSNTIISGGETEIDYKRKHQEWFEAGNYIKDLKIAHFGWWAVEVEEITYSREDVFYYRNLCASYYNSLSWRLMTVIRGVLYRVLKGTQCPPGMIPESEQEARFIMEKIQSSFSWELTAPLRVVTRVFKFITKKNQRL